MISKASPHHADPQTRSQTQFLADVLAGLRSSRKTLPCKYFYDRQGSELFDRICELPEYYPTRVELEIMRHDAAEMADLLGPEPLLIEFGSGSSLKTRLLLDALNGPAAYVPVDISREHLLNSAEKIAQEYPTVNVLPLAADFTRPFRLPGEGSERENRTVYFPGSTIGNFDRVAAAKLLGQIALLVGTGGKLLIGFDLKKDRQVLEKAYNDSANVTAKFNKNLLLRINRELGANFTAGLFTHRAIYDEQAGRIEMQLVSQTRQTVMVAGEQFRFEVGETICTEHSHKYTTSEMTALAVRQGFRAVRSWTDNNQYFCVALYEA